MRGFSSLFCDNGPEKPCNGTKKLPNYPACACAARGKVISRGVLCP